MTPHDFKIALEDAVQKVQETGVVEQLHELKSRINMLDNRRTPVILLPPDINWEFIPFNMIVTARLDSIPENIVSQGHKTLKRMRDRTAKHKEKQDGNRGRDVDPVFSP